MAGRSFRLRRARGAVRAGGGLGHRLAAHAPLAPRAGRRLARVSRPPYGPPGRDRARRWLARGPSGPPRRARAGGHPPRRRRPEAERPALRRARRLRPRPRLRGRDRRGLALIGNSRVVLPSLTSRVILFRILLRERLPRPVP